MSRRSLVDSAIRLVDRLMSCALFFAAFTASIFVLVVSAVIWATIIKILWEGAVK